MVDNKEVATVFEIEKLDEELEKLVPISVIIGRYDEEKKEFISNEGEAYKHIESTEYPNTGFAFRLSFRNMEDFNFDDFIPNQLDSCRSFDYIRYSSSIDKIFISTPEEGFEPLADYDTVYDISFVPTEALPIPSIIEEKVKGTIKGQDDAVRKIVTSLWMTRKFKNISKRNMLVIGPTGVGKTAIFEKLQKVLDIPVTIFPVPGLSQAGYSGRSTDEILKQVYFDCDREKDSYENAIVVLDEIDKLAFTGRDSGEVSTLGVQNELLKITEGVNRTVDLGNGEYFSINTSNIIFIGTGAFTDAYEKESNKIGFGDNKSNSDSIINTKKLEKCGIKSELLRRLPVVVVLNAMTKEILKDIMLNGDESELTNILNSLDSLGVAVRNVDEIIDIIAEDALAKGIGASGLVTTINDIFLEIFYQVANNPDKYSEVVIGKNILNDSSDFKLISRNVKKKVRTAHN